MLAGMALYVRLMVYMGLSLFIIRRALGIYGCMRIYTYNLTPEQTPRADPPPPVDGHCCRWYASYWNAFLFCMDFCEHFSGYIVEE